MKILYNHTAENNSYINDLLFQLRFLYLNNYAILENLLNIFIDKSPILNTDVSNKIRKSISNSVKLNHGQDLYSNCVALHDSYVAVYDLIWSKMFPKIDVTVDNICIESQISSLLLSTITIAGDENDKFDTSRYIENYHKRQNEPLKNI